MQKNRGEPQEKKESHADILIQIGRQAQFLRDEFGQPFAEVTIDGHKELMKINRGRFQDYLTKEFFEEKDKPPSLDALNQALSTLQAIAKFKGEKRKFHRRLAKVGKKFYYDLADKYWRIVRMSEEGSKILKNSPCVFVRTGNTKAQVEPDLENGDLLLLKKHLKLVRDRDWIMCLVYVVTCFVPAIPHPVLVLAGEKGSSKSTTLKMLKNIIDPSGQELLSMPNSKNDLALVLSNSYMPCFDNMDNLSAEKSDLLCMASTGGSISKRKLFSDEEEINLSFKHCVALNGINVIATRADLLDRSVILELSRIPDEERKEESIVWDDFQNDLPRIVGGAMNTLSKAMSIYPTVKIEKLFRMADFTRWGFAVAEALDLDGEEFLKAYRLNQRFANEEAIESHPIAAAVVALMKTDATWNGTVSALLKRLQRIAYNENINTNSKAWPNASHILSRRLKEIKYNLEQKGIFYSIRHGGQAKMISLEKKELPKKA